jgi:hypothetical protein
METVCELSDNFALREWFSCKREHLEGLLRFDYREAA